MSVSRETDLLLGRYSGPLAHHRERFSRTRYPYTYAYDYFRANVPGDYSRAESAGLVREHCKQKGLDPEAIIRELAERYLDEHRVIRPTDI